jgi:hypothetical protein
MTASRMTLPHHARLWRGSRVLQAVPHAAAERRLCGATVVAGRNEQPWFVPERRAACAERPDRHSGAERSGRRRARCLLGGVVAAKPSQAS